MQFVKYKKWFQPMAYFSFSKEKSSVAVINFSFFHKPATITNSQEIPIHISWLSLSKDSVCIVFNIDSKTIETIKLFLERKEAVYKVNFRLPTFSTKTYQKLAQFFSSFVTDGLSFRTCYFSSPCKSKYVAETYVSIDGDCLQKIVRESLEKPELYFASTTHFWLVKKFLDGFSDRLNRLKKIANTIINTALFVVAIFNILLSISTSEIIALVSLIIISYIFKKLFERYIFKFIVELMVNFIQSKWKSSLCSILKILAMFTLDIIIFLIALYSY